MADKYQYKGGPRPPPYDAETSTSKTHYSQGGYYGKEGTNSGQSQDRMVGAFGALAFSEQSVRLGFIKKVYGILTIQLLLTAGIVALFILVEPIKVAMKGNLFVLTSALYVLVVFQDVAYFMMRQCLDSVAVFCSIVALVVILVLALCEGPRRTFPTNLVLLGAFTLAIGVMLGVFSAFASTEAVLIALAITCIVVFALTIFAMLSKVPLLPCSSLLALCTRTRTHDLISLCVP